MKPKPGLVFAVPLSENLFGFGQLIEWQDPIFFMAGYDLQAPSPDFPAKSFDHAKAILVGNFFDVLLRKGRWKSVGIRPVPDVPFPYFKIKIGDTFFIESWDRKQKRDAIAGELSMLQFRSNYGPILLENALRAHFGLQTWEPVFEALTVENALASAIIF